MIHPVLSTISFGVPYDAGVFLTMMPAVAERLVRKFTKSGLGLMYQDPEFDKYTFENTTEVDCGSRVHICGVVYCKLPFALSFQYVVEGVIRWEFGRPYLIAHGDDGTVFTWTERIGVAECTDSDQSPAAVSTARIIIGGRFGTILKKGS